MTKGRVVIPRNDPWLCGPAGLFIFAAGIAILAAHHAVALGVVCFVTGSAGMGRAVILFRRRRAIGWVREPVTATLERLWLPLFAGAVIGAVVGRAAHGTSLERIGLGLTATAAVVSALAFWLAYYEYWTGSGAGRRRTE
jgi:hypothetical protein